MYYTYISNVLDKCLYKLNNPPKHSDFVKILSKFVIKYNSNQH